MSDRFDFDADDVSASTAGDAMGAVLFEVLLSGNVLIEVLDDVQRQRMRRRSDVTRLLAARERWCSAKEAFARALEAEFSQEQEVDHG